MEQKYVLVVDDNSDVRTLVEDALLMFGLESRMARNGSEALAMIQEAAPSAMILDLMMPHVNGFSVLAALSRVQEKTPIPIIILSALVDQAGHVAKLPGVVGVMAKGEFSIERFRSLLDGAGLGLTA